uniref:lysozyme n=1 Tax=Pelusios castaneus TaxID=367368 RepID=A0A8C8RH51_9SAUR
MPICRAQCTFAGSQQHLPLTERSLSLTPGVCMAAHESNYNTAATHYNSYDGSTDFGIFQINSRYWCQYGNEYSSNICQISCTALLSNDISVDVECVKIIARDSNGMSACCTSTWLCTAQCGEA